MFLHLSQFMRSGTFASRQGSSQVFLSMPCLQDMQTGCIQPIYLGCYFCVKLSNNLLLMPRICDFPFHIFMQARNIYVFQL